jgi:hypothetical protein
VQAGLKLYCASSQLPSRYPVCRQWSCRCAGGSAALVVSAQGDADVQRHAGGVAVADVAASGFWGFRCRGARTRMPRNATPDALRCGIVVRNTSQRAPGIGHVAAENRRSRSAPSPRKTWSWLRFSTADVGDFLRRYPRMNASVEVDDASAGPVSIAADSGKQAVRRSHLATSWSMSMPNNEGRRTGIRGNPPTVGDLLLAVSAEKSRGFASKMSVNYRPRK